MLFLPDYSPLTTKKVKSSSRTQRELLDHLFASMNRRLNFIDERGRILSTVVAGGHTQFLSGRTAFLELDLDNEHLIWFPGCKGSTCLG